MAVFWSSPLGSTLVLLSAFLPWAFDLQQGDLLSIDTSAQVPNIC